MTVESTETLAKKYQKELDEAIKRYNKTMGFIDRPPDVPVGQSAKEVVWTRNKAVLYHYLPTTGRRFAEPLLFIYSLMNRPYILDLRPGSSMIEFLVRQGYEVYLLDWGIPGPEDAGLLVDDYAMDYIPRVVKATLRHSKAEKLTLLGYCLGAVLSICYVATHPDAPVKNFVTLTLPLDWSDQTLFNDWLNPKHLNLNQVLSSYVNMPGEFLNFGMRLKDPVNGFITSYTGIFDKITDDRAVESWISMQKWMNDTVPFPGGAFKQIAEEMWLKNKFVKNEFTVRGQKVDLTNIKMSYLNILAERDTIVLCHQSDMAVNMVGSSDKEQIVQPGGHVGLAAGRTAVKGLWPALDKWLSKRSTPYS